MSLPVIMILIVLGLYSLLVLFLTAGLSRLKPTPYPPAKKSSLTLLIPYRNENDSLRGLVSDLAAQTYPGDLYRIIFIDDHSSDGSGQLLKELTGEMENVSRIELEEGARGKKAAIARGIGEADSEWILQTDADCRMGPEFLEKRIAFAVASGADLVAGPVKISSDNPTFLSRFEEMDLLSLVSSAAGSYPYGRPLMCNGANLLYRKSLYGQTRQFDPGRLVSGDDMFLMIGARKMHKMLAFQFSPEATVSTPSSSSWKALLRQRIRWGGKSTAYGLADIQAVALVVVLANLAMITSPLYMILTSGSRPFLLAAMLGKLLVDFLLLFVASGRTGQRRLMLFYVPASILYPAFLVISALGSLIHVPAWKDRPGRRL